MHLIFERYLTLFDQRQRDIKTLRANRVCLKHLDTWFGTYGIDPASPSDDDLQTFFAAQSQQYAFNTVKNRLTIIRSFYAWAAKHGLVDSNPVEDVKIGGRPHRNPCQLRAAPVPRAAPLPQPPAAGQVVRLQQISPTPMPSTKP